MYERGWAAKILEETLARIREEFLKAGKAQHFERLEPQANARAVLTVKIASELGMSEGAIRVAVQRLRRRFIRVLRAEIAKTVASADQVDEEVDHLFKVVGA